MISIEEYEQMKQLLTPLDHLVQTVIQLSSEQPSHASQTFEVSPSSLALEPLASLEECSEEHLSSRKEELVQPCDPSLPLSSPALERQAGLYISRSETSDGECSQTPSSLESGLDAVVVETK